MADRPATTTYEIRVWLPDRPGALGEVAGRIGSVGADVVGIEILETGGGSAIDDLLVALPDTVPLERLIEAIASADGVAVEEVARLERPRPDPALGALEIVRAVAAEPPRDRLTRFCRELRSFIDGEWAAAVRLSDDSAVAMSGRIPDLPWLSAFLRGSKHLTAEADTTPGDIVWCALPSTGIRVASGRDGRVFHAREREMVRLLGDVVDLLVLGALG